ncbi:amidohydrolase family protein [Aureimonas altamirensis]|uniref:amidohydrolase family protein n=1 Tax=Aureimonas altamirensis TaxID=370622 RepID=UPI0022B6BC4A|nr:amidohydrolase family protein [Aureimonas altamirensis]
MDTTRTLVDALYAGVFRNYTNLKLIVAHAGGVLPLVAPRLFTLGTLPWVPNPHDITVAEMKEQLSRLYYDVAISANSAALSGLLELTDERHIVFGTDYPPATERGIEENIAALNVFAEHQGQQTLRYESIAGNALDLFPGIQQRI